MLIFVCLFIYFRKSQSIRLNCSNQINCGAKNNTTRCKIKPHVCKTKDLSFSMEKLHKQARNSLFKAGKPK